ncbi:hypothetical protein BJX61DRAFT_451398 [Aspergillus egyptiacus]|nr:hypothetical protein BJX61DRAFT_451398 [Aspergillus egyptiacus]
MNNYIPCYLMQRSDPCQRQTGCICDSSFRPHYRLFHICGGLGVVRVGRLPFARCGVTRTGNAETGANALCSSSAAQHSWTIPARVASVISEWQSVERRGGKDPRPQWTEVHEDMHGTVPAHIDRHSQSLPLPSSKSSRGSWIHTLGAVASNPHPEKPQKILTECIRVLHSMLGGVTD